MAIVSEGVVSYWDYWDLTDREIAAWVRVNNEIVKERNQARRSTGNTGFV